MPAQAPDAPDRSLLFLIVCASAPPCRHALLVSTAGGGFGVWAPVWDGAACARLAALLPLLGRALPHPAGLNPAAFRCGLKSNKLDAECISCGLGGRDA